MFAVEPLPADHLARRLPARELAAPVTRGAQGLDTRRVVVTALHRLRDTSAFVHPVSGRGHRIRRPSA